MAAAALAATTAGLGRAQPPAPAPAAAFVSEAWTVQDGLPVNGTTAVLQGRQGYIWLATWDGLVRFDGVRFTVFNTGNSDSLPSNRLVQMVELPDGSLFLRTAQNHIVRWRAGVFTHFDARHGLPDANTVALYRDATGRLWAATGSGVRVLEGDHFVSRAPAIRVPTTAVLRDADGTLWIGTSTDGVYRVRGAEVARYDAANGLHSSKVTQLAQARDGTIWVGTEDGAYRIRGARAERVVQDDGRPLPLEVLGMRAAPARDGVGADEVWVVMHGGLYVARGGRLHPVLKAPGVAPFVRFDAAGVPWYGAGSALYRDGRLVFHELPNEPGAGRDVSNFRDLTWDHEGSVWLATDGSGVYRLKPSLFGVYREAEGLASRVVLSVFADRAGSLWFGTAGHGVARLAGKHVTNYTPARGAPWFVLAIMQDHRGDLWLGSMRQGALRCRLPAMACQPATRVQPAREMSVRALYEDATADVWAGTEQGLYRLHGGSWQRVAAADDAGVVRFFLAARDGTLWMATDGGGLLAVRDGRFSRITTADGLPSDLVRTLYEDPRGRLWVGTEGRGLARLTPAIAPDGRVTAAQIRTVRQRDGLFDEVIHAILPDDAGRLWMSTNRGIFWVRSDDLDAFADGRRARVQSTGYTEHDGLRNREANGGYQPAGVRAPDGRLWFATQGGAVVVDPSRVGRNQVPPPVVVEQIRTRRGVRTAADARASLEPDERSFEIDYTALSFVAPENVRFRYRLEGLDDGWVDAGTRRTAFYTNVPPGDYTFRVIASNNDGVWNERGAALALRVAPRFAETWLARALAVCALALAAAAGYRWRVRRLRRRAGELARLVETRTAQLREHEASLQAQNAQLAVQARRLSELDAAKSRLFANLSHEFRTPLTLILAPLRGMLAGRYGPLSPEVREQGALMLRNGQRLLRLINQVLDLAKLQADRMVLTRRPGDLVAFVGRATLAFAPLADGRQVALHFRSAVPELPFAFDADQLEKMLFNLLSNALKFTEAGGAVEVVLTADDGGAVIAVRDSGVGIAPDALPYVFERFYQTDATSTRRYEGTGIGLALARELVELHGGTIRAESTLGAGSTFTVWLPSDEAAIRAQPRPTEVEPADGGAAGELEIPARRDVVHAEPEDVGEGECDAAGDRTTVLVIDDNADVRTYVRSLLAPRYTVIEAADGAAGLERARALLPDLIVADVMMPELDGFALGRALKDDVMTDAIPVVLLTARATAADQVEGFGTGADAYLTKPFDPAVLEACVTALLTQRRRLRARIAGQAPGDESVAAPAAEPSGCPAPHEPNPPPTAPEPSALVQRLRAVVVSRLTGPDLDPKVLAAAAGLSYHQLYRALRDECDMSPSRFIRGVRAECAADLLRRREGTITEVAYAVGFDSLSYFSRAFRERYGAAPSAYLATSPGAPTPQEARTGSTPAGTIDTASR